jgi:G3E family GTPase
MIEISVTPINVFIISGFLGAGKTTILNCFLQQFENQKNVVIENEVGKVNIDSSLLKYKIELVYGLTNGCICCSLDDDLLSVLKEISQKNTLPDNLFIETTGIADPGAVAAVFKTPALSEAFQLKKTVCVVDAPMLEYFLNNTEETQKQIVNCDLIVINKTEKLDSDKQLHLESTLKSINPFANITSSAMGYVESNLLFENSKPKKMFFSKTYAKENPHKITTDLYETTSRFDIKALENILSLTLQRYYSQIYRIKGFVIDKNEEVYLVQSTGNSLNISKYNNSEIQMSQLVFIGKEILHKTIERLLKPALVYKKVKL